MNDDRETCRYCGRLVEVDAPTNHYGGYVCSESCDVKACLEMSSSMPGAGPASRLDDYERKSVEDNWRDEP